MQLMTLGLSSHTLICLGDKPGIRLHIKLGTRVDTDETNLSVCKTWKAWLNYGVSTKRKNTKMIITHKILELASMYANIVASSKVIKASPCWLPILVGSSSFFLSSGWHRFTIINPLIMEMFVWSCCWLDQPELIKLFNLLCGLYNWSECASLNIVSYIGRKNCSFWGYPNVRFDAFIFSVAKPKYFGLKAE